MTKITHLHQRAPGNTSATPVVVRRKMSPHSIGESGPSECPGWKVTPVAASECSRALHLHELLPSSAVHDALQHYDAVMSIRVVEALFPQRDQYRIGHMDFPEK